MPHRNRRPSMPADALAELLAGNERFVTGNPIHPHQDAQRLAALATAQQPFAVVFGCSDSRLAAEIIFDRGLGDLFVIRTAGHVIGPEVLASIEYGVAVLGAPLVVVLGHESCGAIRAAHEALAGNAPTGGDLRPIIDGVTPSIQQALTRELTDDSAITQVHIQRTVARIEESGVADAVTAGRCAVIGMSYRLSHGRVALITSGPTWL